MRFSVCCGGASATENNGDSVEGVGVVGVVHVVPLKATPGSLTYGGVDTAIGGVETYSSGARTVGGATATNEDVFITAGAPVDDEPAELR